MKTQEEFFLFHRSLASSFILVNPFGGGLLGFPETLKKLRKEHKITQSTLSKELGVTDRAVRMYEAGEIEPTMSVLIKLANFFGVSLDYLVGRSDE